MPKGWPEKNRTHADAAAREAFEEAGLHGTVGPRAFRSLNATKDLEHGLELSIRLEVYLLKTRAAGKCPEGASARFNGCRLPKPSTRRAKPD